MADVDGIWEIRIETGKGDKTWQLHFAGDGAAVTGKLVKEFDWVALEAGRIDGDVVTWEVTMNPPNQVHGYGRATVAGDAITGVLDLGTYGERSFAGKRT